MRLFLYPGFTAYLLFYLSFWSKCLLKEISDRRAEPAFCAPQPFIMWVQADRRAPLAAWVRHSCGFAEWSVVARPSCLAAGAARARAGADCPFQQHCFMFLPPLFAIRGVFTWRKRAKLKKKKKRKKIQNCFSVLYLARLYHYIMQVHFEHYRSNGG